MKNPVSLLFILLGALASVSCSTPDYDSGTSPARPYIPRVTMPVNLSRNAQNLIGDVEQSLEQNGLRPTDRAGAEYQLAFSVEDGPVNADVTLDLYQGRDRVAHAFARTGGPRIIFKRQQVIRESFDKALRQFEAQLPRPGGGYRQAPGNYQETYRENNSQPGPYGQPEPYGQTNPDYSY